KGIVQGDLGISYKTRGPVGDDVFYRIPISLKIALITTAIMVIIGVPLGVLCAVKQYTAFDDIVNVLSKFLGAIPSFWLGLMLMIWFSVGLGWFPTYGIKDGVKSYVLPIFTLLLPFLAQFVRQVRSAMLDCIRQDYVRTARAKGATERRVIYHEALKNALLPIITFGGGCFASMIGGAVTVEKLFAIPGIGYKVVEAINTRDIPTMLACVLFLSIMTIVVQLLIDLSYAWIDPRVRSTFVSGKKKKPTPKKAEEVKA
ncbi:MAG: ABC transporter permease, partial [Clostridia bacterium]|nr:ABC transporter permease [Clostridia bacterium]